MNKYLFPGVVLALLLVPGWAHAVPKVTPMEQVRESTEKVITILQDETLDQQGRWDAIGVIINDRFDFRSMSQSILATNWQRATPEERERFVEYFSQYIEETYRTKIESYDNQEILYKNETIYGKRAEVETAIVTESTEIPIVYKLKDNDGKWFAYDVVIEGVSLVNNYRSTFSTIVKNDGMDGLLNDIKRRVDKYKQENAGNVEPVPESTESE